MALITLFHLTRRSLVTRSSAEQLDGNLVLAPSAGGVFYHVHLKCEHDAYSLLPIDADVGFKELLH